jgi:hypothetical protein
MNSVDRKGHFPHKEASDLKVKPALRIPLIRSTLGVWSRPDTVMIIRISVNFRHVTRIKTTAEKYVLLFRFSESNPSVMRNYSMFLIRLKLHSNDELFGCYFL